MKRIALVMFALCIGLLVVSSASAQPGPGEVLWGSWIQDHRDDEANYFLQFAHHYRPQPLVWFGEGEFSLENHAGNFPDITTNARTIRGSGRAVFDKDTGALVSGTLLVGAYGQTIRTATKDYPIDIENLTLEGANIDMQYRPGVKMTNVEMFGGEYGVYLTSLYSSGADFLNCHFHHITSSAIEIDIRVGSVQVEDSTIYYAPMVYSSDGTPSGSGSIIGAPNAGFKILSAYENGIFTLLNSDIKSCESYAIASEGAAGYTGYGSGPLTLDDGCTVSGNVATAGSSGAVWVKPGSIMELEINRSQISLTEGNGVGVYSQGGDLTVTNSLFTGNDTHGVYHDTSSGWATIVNNTFENNGGYDFGARAWAGGTIRNNIADSWYGNSGAIFPGNILRTDAGLDANLVPIVGGRAHDTGDSTYAGLAGDYDFGGRYGGYPRVAGCSIDMGAHEEQTPPPAVVVDCQDVSVELDASGNGSIITADVGEGSGGCGTLTDDSYVATFDCADIGDNTVTLTVTDELGESDSCEVTVTVLPPPVVAICQDITDSLGSLGTGNINADYVDGGSSVACGSLSFSFLNEGEGEFSCADIGNPVTVNLKVTGGYGQFDTCTADVTVLDERDPTITAPADVTVGTDDLICSASGVDLGSATTDDNCSVASVTNDAVEPYALGDTTVTWTVTDSSGNTATATQIVTVTDDEAPVIPDGGCALAPGVNPAGKSNPNLAAGFRVILDEAKDNCGVVGYVADIDGLPIDYRDKFQITIARGQVGAKLTSTAGGVQHIIAQNGNLALQAVDAAGTLSNTCRAKAR